MKIEKLMNTKAVTAVAFVAAVGVLAYLSVNQAKAAASMAAQAVNPLNDDNIFASGVDAVGAKLSSNSEWTLGGWIYDITH